MNNLVKKFLLNGTSLSKPVFMASFAATLCVPAFAEEVTLRSSDGAIELSGEIQAIEDDSVVLRTNLGDLHLGFHDLTCIGAACPPALIELLAQQADDDHDDDDHGDDDHDDDDHGDEDHAENDHDDDHGDEDDHDDDHDDHDEPEIALADFNFSVNMVAPVGIADVLMPVLAQGLAEAYEANVVATDGYGEPLPDDIGRPAFGGAHAHGHGDHDDADADDHSVDDHEPENLVDIRFVTNAGTLVERLGVVIEEGTEIAHLSRSEADVVFIDHPANPDEINRVAAGGGGNISDDGQERVLAVEGLVVAVSPDNPIAHIPASAIAAIFSGEMTNWSQVGGPDAPIHLYSFGEDNAAFHYVEEMILAPAEVEMASNFIEVEKMRELAGQIYDDPLAIGLLPFANLRGTRPVPVESTCGLVSTPTEFTIKTEEYTIQRRYHAYNRADVSPATQAFLDFLDTEQADDLVRKAGFIDLSVDSMSLQSDVERIDNIRAITNDGYESRILEGMMAEMDGMDRLSTNFRFAFGSSRLDVRARADVQRVVQHIEANNLTDVKLVGFTDSVGSFEANEVLAENRAETIRRTILSSLPTEVAQNLTISTQGFGELAPVACNDNTNGRRINRRVEIWVR